MFNTVPKKCSCDFRKWDRGTTAGRDVMFKVLLRIRPATWMDFSHEMRVSISWSSQSSWWGLILAQMHPVHEWLPIKLRLAYFQGVIGYLYITDGPSGSYLYIADGSSGSYRLFIHSRWVIRELSVIYTYQIAHQGYSYIADRSKYCVCVLAFPATRNGHYITIFFMSEQ